MTDILFLGASVCVWTYLQNTKLKISALEIPNIDYNNLMLKSLCKIINRDCMIQACKILCEKKELNDYLEEF